MGRRPLGDQPMTGAERMRRYRAAKPDALRHSKVRDETVPLDYETLKRAYDELKRDHEELLRNFHDEVEVCIEAFREGMAEGRRERAARRANGQATPP